jgi:hypothetical protein
MPIIKKPLKHGEDEYRFVIDAYTPNTIPMARLAEYMAALSQMLGEPSAVHFKKLESGSTVVVSRVQREAAPKVRQRVSAVRRGEGPKEARAAYQNINRLLRADNGVGVLKDTKSAIVIRFPGRDEVQEEFTAVRQHGSIDGVITGIRGKDETIHITLQSEGQQLSGIETNRTIAKQLGAKLFEPVRLFGRGRWARDADGNWSLITFKVESFEGLRDVPLSTALDELRSIPTEWTDESYGELGMIRHGPTGKRNGGH